MTNIKNFVDICREKFIKNSEGKCDGVMIESYLEFNSSEGFVNIEQRMVDAYNHRLIDAFGIPFFFGSHDFFNNSVVSESSYFSENFSSFENVPWSFAKFDSTVGACDIHRAGFSNHVIEYDVITYRIVDALNSATSITRSLHDNPTSCKLCVDIRNIKDKKLSIVNTVSKNLLSKYLCLFMDHQHAGDSFNYSFDIDGSETVNDIKEMANDFNTVFLSSTGINTRDLLDFIS